MRKKILESPEFLEVKEKEKKSKHPIYQIFKNHKKILLTVILTIILHDLSFYVLFAYMTTCLTRELHLSENAAFSINTLNMIAVCGFTVLGAWLSDRFGRKKIMAIAALMFIVGTIPLFYMIINTTIITTIFLAQLILAIAVGGYFGPTPAMMVEAYPTAIRYSAISITTNISGPLFGGTAPMLMTYLIDKSGSMMLPAFYLTLVALISLVALRFVPQIQCRVAVSR